MTTVPFQIWRTEREEPIYITKNGEGDLVVMSIEAFEQREEALKLQAKLEAAEQGRLCRCSGLHAGGFRKRLEEIIVVAKIENFWSRHSGN